MNNHNPFYGIPPLSFPYVSHCELYNAFGNGWMAEEGKEPVYNVEMDECKVIKDLGELLVFQNGSVGNNEQNSKVRDSEVAWINDDPNQPALDKRQWLIQRMADIIGMVNRDKFQMDLDGFHPLQFTRYGLNQHYDWHVDVHENQQAIQHRKLSATLMLSDPNDYEGGELELNIGGNPDNILRLKPPKGTIVFFYSHVPHRVLPVTKGDRASIVAWAMGPKVR